MSRLSYADYKDSGAEWLGEVPSHWTVARIGALFREVVEEGEEGLPILSVSIHNGVSDKELDEKEAERKVTRSEDATTYKAVRLDDLVYNMMRAWQGAFGAVQVAGMVSPAYVVARPTEEFLTRYVELVLRTPNAVEEMRRHSQGVTDFRLRLYWDEFKTIRVALPPLAEQAAVLSFLDRETAKIDSLVAEQETLIALVKEKRQAVISHAVTKGLNPAAPMKDSGVGLLGEVPEHWKVSKLKYFWGVVDCKHVTAEFFDDGIPVASIREVQGRFVNLNEAKKTTEHFYELLVEEGRKPTAGDLIFSRNATVGEVAEVANWHPLFAMGQDVCLLRKLNGNYSTTFLRLVLRSEVTACQLALCMVGSTFKRVNVEEIRNLVVPMPPADEQSKIVSFIEAQTTKLDALVAEAERAIDLLREHRAALISAAVTGKIDVRGLVDMEAA